MWKWPVSKQLTSGFVVFPGILISILTCIFYPIAPDISTRLDNFFFDALAEIAVRPYEMTPVRIVDIDDRSLNALGQWPWPRNQLAQLTDRLQRAGAKAIAFDFLFSEPDRTSPSQLVAGLPPSIRALAAQIPALDHDAAFAESLVRSPSILPVGLVNRQTDTPLGKTLPLALVGEVALEELPHYDGAIANLPALQQAAPGLATFSFAATERVVRAVPLLSVYDNQLIPSLSLEALRIATGGRTIAIKARTVDGEPGLAIRVGRQVIPVGMDGMMRLHYAGHRPERVIPALDVLANPVSEAVAAKLKGAIVLIGTSATGLSDLRPTPVDPYLPGVEIHAEAIEHMLLGLALQRPARLVQGETIASLVVGVAATVITFAFGGVIGLLLTGVVAATGVTLAVWAFTSHDLLINPLPTILVCVAAVILTAFLRHAILDRNRRWLKRAFGHYLSPELVEQVARNPQAISLGGETREITCLFTDLEGFTALSERLPPPVLVEVMNGYLDGLCQVAKSNGGTVLKIIGDSVHVVFNAPMDQPDHALRALDCARDCQDFSEDFRRQQATQGRAIGRTRIGIATGPAVVGNFGGTTRFDYTAYGDTVNTAARLEAANKTLGSGVLMTERTAIAAAHAATPHGHLLRPVGPLAVMGKSEPVQAVELLTAGRDNVDFAGFLAALAALGRDDGTGHAAMAAYAAAFPDDPVARLMLERVGAAARSVREPRAVS